MPFVRNLVRGLTTLVSISATILGYAIYKYQTEKEIEDRLLVFLLQHTLLLLMLVYKLINWESPRQINGLKWICIMFWMFFLVFLASQAFINLQMHTEFEIIFKGPDSLPRLVSIYYGWYFQFGLYTGAFSFFFLFACISQSFQTRTEEKQKILQALEILKVSAQGDEDHCSVCLLEYQANQIIYKLRCNHFFHTSCLYKWVNQSQTCPLCREDLKKYIQERAQTYNIERI